jgi:hypothetical protein
MIVQVAELATIAKDNLTRYTVIPLLQTLSSRGRNISWRSRSTRKRTEVVSDNLSQPGYYIVNGDCLSRSAARLLGFRPMKIRNGNGAFVVVRAGESPVHANIKKVCNGEGGQLISLVQLTENV